MLILPSDNTTFQINYREALGRALNQALEKNPSLTLLAARAFDDYDLGDTLFEIEEDRGTDRVRRLSAGELVAGESLILCADVGEYQTLLAAWSGQAAKMWRVPITNGAAVTWPAQGRVFAPCTTQDAFSLTAELIRQESSCVVLEHRTMYSVEGYVDLGLTENLDRAKIRREGTDLTLVAASWCLVEALQVAELLAQIGIQAEVIDLRFLQPLDLAIVRQSLAKTKRGVVLDHIPALSSLRALCAPGVNLDCPLSFTSQLASAEVVGTIRTLRVCEDLLGKSNMDVGNVAFYGYGRTFCGPF